MSVEADLGHAAVNAKILPVLPPGLPVIFNFNPATITMTRTVSSRAHGDPDGIPPIGSTDSEWSATTPPTMAFKAQLEGPQTAEFAGLLLDMMAPAGGLTGMIMAALGINLSFQLPRLVFEWGTTVFYCTMKQCSISYTRFHSSGTPLRAECTLTLEQAKSWLGSIPTNPTSGGLPGREQHMVVAGENLPQLAMSRFGHPRRWRDIADANGIDDPFRVRPGDVVFIPSPAELSGGSR
jgi:nucleoid-associated protein YgaU